MHLTLKPKIKPHGSRENAGRVFRSLLPPQGAPQLAMSPMLSRVWATLIQMRVAFHIILLALREYRSLYNTWRVLKKLYVLKSAIVGSVNSKIAKVDGRYYHYLYAPGYPSANFDRYIKGEFHRIVPIKTKVNALTFIHLAVTKKCPLRCEHCLEWHNLNQPESLTAHQLAAVVSKFQNDGIAQFHLTGGEPMVRVKEMLPIIRQARGETEFYVLTSGFNFTDENAAALKSAGLTGVVISLDHFEADKHNSFRGSERSYADVVRAVQIAHAHNFVIAVTVCVTKEFLSWDNLLQYAALAKNLKVAYIQLLEPKAVGHYEGKDVLLSNDHFDLLDRFFLTVNKSREFATYPIVIYHGYHQRRSGCMAGGNRTLYIDSEGWVNACPFCHTKNMNVKSMIDQEFATTEKLVVGGCERY